MNSNFRREEEKKEKIAKNKSCHLPLWRKRFLQNTTPIVVPQNPTHVDQHPTIRVVQTPLPSPLFKPTTPLINYPFLPLDAKSI